jgi:hypothetical protein
MNKKSLSMLILMSLMLSVFASGCFWGRRGRRSCYRDSRGRRVCRTTHKRRGRRHHKRRRRR